MSFTVAPCLLTLRDEINDLAPHRDKASDGTIGDAAHQQRKSDHNPDADGVVRALDVTHDPAGGADMAVLAKHLRSRQDPRTKYVIFNRRIFSPRSNWAWRPFDGQSHAHHLHLSVVADGRADDPSRWGLRDADPAPEHEDNEMPSEILPDQRGKAVLRLQLLMIRVGLISDIPANRDEHYGTATQRVIQRFQRAQGLFPDMRVGRKTWAALLALTG